MVWLLETQDFRVGVAANGLEAVAAPNSLPYNLVLMDVQMPEMDGMEATRRIRNLAKPAAETPIIAVTAHALTGDRARFLQAGMNDYISKPIDKDDLFQKVQFWIKAAAETPEEARAPAKPARQRSAARKPRSRARRG